MNATNPFPAKRLFRSLLSRTMLTAEGPFPFPHHSEIPPLPHPNKPPPQTAWNYPTEQKLLLFSSHKSYLSSPFPFIFYCTQGELANCFPLRGKRRRNFSSPSFSSPSSSAVAFFFCSNPFNQSLLLVQSSILTRLHKDGRSRRKLCLRRTTIKIRGKFSILLRRPRQSCTIHGRVGKLLFFPLNI